MNDETTSRIEEIDALRVEKRMLQIQALEFQLALFRSELQREVEHLESRYEKRGWTLNLNSREWTPPKE
jgi:hypothetical protein